MKKLNILLIASCFLISCNSTSNTPDPDPTSGDITGSVLLFDEGIANQSPSGMKVTVENLTPEKSAITDNSGKFSIPDVPFGTYALVYEKTGFGVFKKTGIEHTSAATPITDIPSLGQLSTTSVTELSATPSGKTIQTSVTTSPPGNNANRRYVRFFFGDTPDVSSTKYKAFSPIYVVQDAPYTRVFTEAELNQFGITVTGTIHIRAYGESFFSNSYVDPQTQKTIFPNLNPTTVGAVSVSF
ncbi:carboxypeptidase-like regulatory domain-containing protein [Algoriphagus litoralis]|uniref:carboxypeptidase-like regulatory domain-containing protein n=1 Tax=Algoriphagus litoralis TaxID=2202829 RepID=UPI0013009395|nr:carboxypeptidase-like regulatory domain-containing protein [Algoriphagus litoralis]